jgi:hypothetical protein
MKTLNKISILVLVLVLSLPVFGQNRNSIGLVDTALTVSLENIERNVELGTFRFDINLERTSQMWHLWENATFQMEFFLSTGEQIDYKNYDVLIDASSSDIVGGYLAAPLYSFYSKVLYDGVRKMNNRVKLAVIGPNAAAKGKQFDEHSKLRLCKVILRSKDASLYPPPVNVDWKMPFDYYQATAYKFVKGVDDTPEYTIVEGDEDNIEIGWITKYVSRPQPEPSMQLADFEVEYTGNLNTVCRWRTRSEYNNLGFVIKRAVYENPMLSAEEYEALPDDIFTHIVGDYRDAEFADRMKGELYSYTIKEYSPIPDKIEVRMMNYVYRLYYHPLGIDGDTVDMDLPLVKLATRNLITPNGVITMATASPNPCSGQSRIDYIVDDDVYLTCEVFDQTGHSVKKLYDNVNGLLDKKYVPMGRYTAEFIAPEIASQGLYTVQFIAYPVNDKTVELSRALIKLQLVRGYNAGN